MNKHIASILFLTFSFSFCVAQSGTSLTFNGTEVKPGELQHKILCYNQEDTFSLSYTPANPVEESKYVIGGVEFWAQLSMGKPQVIGRIAFSEPADNPSIEFTLKDFNAEALLPNQTDAVRVTIRVAQVLQVQGKRMLGFEALDEKKRSASFMLIKACQ